MKRLYRSRRDQMLAGVAAGMADHLKVDPTLMRLLWVLAGLSGFGVAGYIIAAIIIPLEPDFIVREPAGPESTSDDPTLEKATIYTTSSSPGSSETISGNRSLGWILVILGGLFFINQVLPRWTWNRLWPVLLIGLGIYLLVDRGRST